MRLIKIGSLIRMAERGGQNQRESTVVNVPSVRERRGFQNSLFTFKLVQPVKSAYQIYGMRHYLN